MRILRLDNVSKSFGALKVSDQITFDLEEGVALGVIGPNGAGKSTLFNLITGNLSPDEGAVWFNGEDVTDASPMRRCREGIGRSFQIPQPFSGLTVFENLLVSGAFGQDLPEAEVADQCAEILVETEMIDRANTRASDLRLLERKRLELARAMATKPKLLLLDEIAGGLTDGECQSLIATIRRIHNAGVTIVWIEHVLHALTAVAERLLVLDFGRVVGLGAPEEVMASRAVKEIYLGIDA